MPDGSCVNQCPSDMIHRPFGNGSAVIQCVSLTSCQRNNPMTPFLLEGSQCVGACPTGTAATLGEDGVTLKCLKTS